MSKYDVNISETTRKVDEYRHEKLVKSYEDMIQMKPDYVPYGENIDQFLSFAEEKHVNKFLAKYLKAGCYVIVRAGLENTRKDTIHAQYNMGRLF